MKIDHLSIERFGIWSEAQIDNLSDGLNVFYGSNGSGKTTLMQFMRSVLYGFPAQNSDRYIPPVHKGRQGGQIAFSHANSDFAISRFATDKEAGELALKGDAATTKYVRNLLADIGEPAFNVLFTVGYREADSFDRLEREALADRADNWIAAPELAEVTAALGKVKSERKSLFNKDHASRMRDLAERRTEIENEIQRLTENLSVPDGSVERIQREIAAVEQEMQRVEIELRNIKDVEPQQQTVTHAEHHLCQPAIPVGLSITEDIRQLDQQILTWRRRCREVDEDLVRAQQQVEQLHHVGQEWAEGAQLANIDRARDCVQELKTQLRSLQHRLGISQNNMTEFTEGWQGNVDRLRNQVYELCREVGRQELMQRRSSVNSEIQQLRRCRVEMRRNLKILLRRRRFLIETYGVENAEFRKQAVHSVCNCAEPNQYQPPGKTTQTLVTPVDNSANVRLRAELRARLEELRKQRERLLAQLRAAQVELRGTGDEKRIERLQFELNMVNEQFARALHRYETLSATIPVLKKLKAEYEARRQPVILKEASGYLRQLTDNAYESIVPDASVAALQVVRADGQSFHLQGLSRGTRDQVALSLRLAVASAYRRRNQQLPIVLDDVLLTSDDNRAEAVATLLRDYAATGQQIIVFTCREPIAQLFRTLDVKVRNLPTTQRQVAPPSVPMPVATPRVIPKVELPVMPVIQPPEFVKPIEKLPAPEPVAFLPQQIEIEPEPAPVVVPQPVTASQDAMDTPGRWIFYLETESDFDDFESIDRDAYEALLRNGVRNVDDLLAVVPDAAALQMSDSGITPAQIRSWQTQAMLSCRVPMLRIRDSWLLTESGVTDVDQLARMHPEELFAQVDRYLQTPGGRRFVHRESPFDMQTAISWIRYSRHARSLWDSRDSRRLNRSSRRIDPQESEQTSVNFLSQSTGSSSRTPLDDFDNDYDYEYTRNYRQNNNGNENDDSDYDRERDGEKYRTVARSEYSGGERSPYESDGDGSRGSGSGTGSGSSGSRRSRSARTTSNRDSSRSGSSSGSRSSSGTRSSSSRSGSRSSGTRTAARRTSRTSTRTSSKRTSRTRAESSKTKSLEATGEKTLKFYLNTSDPVEDGPSIGPKTAERLAAAGIYTVDDLLKCNVDDVVAVLKNRRINAAKLTAWQQQAKLCCQIPELRGHDSQILVACEINDPVELSGMRPNDLFAIVAPFVETSEGERIIRNGKKPDLDEITDWISWASQHRGLSAA